jgi:chromosome segregation ATPase
MIYDFIQKLWQKEYFRYAVFSVSGLLVGAAATTALYPTKEIREEAFKSAKTEAEQEFNLSIKETLKSHQETVNTIIARTNEESQSLRKSNDELSQKVSSLTTENTQLKSKRRTETVIVKDPSGKEETHIVDVTETESNTSKTEQVVQELTKKHEEEIKTLEQKQVFELTSQKAKSDREIESAKKEASVYKAISESLEKTNKTEVINPKKVGLGLGYTTDMLYSAEASYQFWGPVYGGLSGDSDLKAKYRGRLSIGVRL